MRNKAPGECCPYDFNKNKFWRLIAISTNTSKESEVHAIATFIPQFKLWGKHEANAGKKD